MAFFIKVHQTRADHLKSLGVSEAHYGYADNRDIIAYINDHRRAGGVAPLTSNKMPKDFSCSLRVPLKDGRSATVAVVEGNPPRVGNFGRTISSSKHRVFVQCPDCAARVPAGRTHQHKCKG